MWDRICSPPVPLAHCREGPAPSLDSQWSERQPQKRLESGWEAVGTSELNCVWEGPRHFLEEAALAQE